MNINSYLLVALILSLIFVVLIAAGGLAVWLIWRRKASGQPVLPLALFENRSARIIPETGTLELAGSGQVTSSNSTDTFAASVSNEERARLLRKVNELEVELFELKAALHPPAPSLINKLQNAFRFGIQHWALFSLLGSIILAFYIQFAFGVDYFESFREIRATKDLSEFYRAQGDIMLEKQEFDAAKEAYNRAIEIDANNTQAVYGLAKSQVFDPIEGKKFTSLDVAEEKLDYLLLRFEDDYQLYFLKGWLYYLRNDPDEANRWMNEAVRLNPNFSGGYVMLGLFKMKEDPEGAAEYYEQALQIDPNHPVANNNMGYSYLLQGKIPNAIQHLEMANKLDPALVTTVNLATAYLLSGDLISAKIYYQNALDTIEAPGEELERYIGGEWFVNSLPRYTNDIDGIKYWARFYNLDRKRILIYYDMSFYFALTGNLELATEYFDAAMGLDKFKDYNTFFSYRMQSILNFTSMKSDVKSWFQTSQGLLDNVQ